ncbi:MAG: VWA domain-containing protein [Firmicutes bacterium]|nr:VWA domain-containing protein [Bacillota bacterium]
MVFNVMEFVSLLKKAGIVVSYSEIMDFMSALTLAGVGRDGFLWAMEAALVKDGNREAACRILDLFLQDAQKSTASPKAAATAKDAPRLDRENFQGKLDHLKNFIRNEKMRLAGDPAGRGAASCGSGIKGAGLYAENSVVKISSGESFVSMLTGGDSEKMRLAAREAADRLVREEFDQKDFIKRLKVVSGWAEGEEILGRMAERGAGPDRWALESLLQKFTGMAAGEWDRASWEKDPEIMLGRYDTSGVSFNRLDYDEAMDIKRKLVMLGRSLAARRGYRYRASPKGTVDLRRTAALAGIYGGIPVKLLLRNRIPTSPEIVILCDLSGSVSSFSRFMMLMVSAMHDRFRSVRSFAFVDGVEEITGMIRGWDAQKKISRILRETRIWQTGFSDYGAVWKLFGENFARVINRKTTLLILGDARNNYRPDGLDHFIGLAGRARRVIWLNPAPVQEWDREDSIISRYSPHCHMVIECRNLKQLEKAARYVFI